MKLIIAVTVTIRDESENEKSIVKRKSRANRNRAREGGDRILPTSTMMRNGDTKSRHTRSDERSILDMMMIENHVKDYIIVVGICSAKRK